MRLSKIVMIFFGGKIKNVKAASHQRSRNAKPLLLFLKLSSNIKRYMSRTYLSEISSCEVRRVTQLSSTDQIKTDKAKFKRRTLHEPNLTVFRIDSPK